MTTYAAIVNKDHHAVLPQQHDVPPQPLERERAPSPSPPPQPRRKRRNYNERYTTVENSILNTVWVEPTRPYSQHELEDIRERLFTKCQLSNVYMFHEQCGHVYHVKQNGVKYKQLTSPNPAPMRSDNCSVCWKLRKTPRPLVDAALNIVDLFSEEFGVDTNSYYKQELYRILYTWLYIEYYDDDDTRRR